MTPIEEQIQNLLLATTKMEKTQEITTENVNKLVVNMEKLIPINEKINSIENIINEKFNNIENRIGNLENEQKQGISPTVTKWILGLIITYAITFGTWVTSQISKVDYATIDNKNQITYLKGRLKAQNE